MEPRISSLVIDPALLAKDGSSRTISTVPPASRELPFDAVRHPGPGQQAAFRAPSHASSSFVTLRHPVSGYAKHSASSIPLAEVLNDEGDAAVLKESLSYILQDQGSRRKRKADGNDRLRLPQPPAPPKKIRRARIPPLLPGLYEPPPNAGLFPAITTDAPTAPTPIPKASPPTPPKSPLQAPKDAEKEKSAGKEEEESGFIVLQLQGVGDPTAQAEEREKSKHKRRPRREWTDEQTTDLLKGVARFGIGKWTKILKAYEKSFDGRTANDLKDRFRICCPEEYRNSAKQRGTDTTAPSADQNESIQCQNLATPDITTETSFRPKQSHKKNSDDLATLGIQKPFKKGVRRQRRPYTKEEDEALLKGFLKHGPYWHKIKHDSGLGFSDRSSEDLRSRFRNAYPDKFSEAGLKLPKNSRSKQVEEPSRAIVSDSDKPAAAGEAASKETGKRNTPEPLTVPNNVVSKTRASNPLKLLDNPFPGLFDDDDYPDYSRDDHGQIPLNRTILDWADQHIPHASTTSDSYPSALYALPPRVTELPSFTHLDSLVNLNYADTAMPKGGPGGPTYRPAVPLPSIVTDSNVKNSTSTLPPAADLMIGLEPENQTNGLWGPELAIRPLFEF